MNPEKLRMNWRRLRYAHGRKLGRYNHSLKVWLCDGWLVQGYMDAPKRPGRRRAANSGEKR